MPGFTKRIRQVVVTAAAAVAAAAVVRELRLPSDERTWHGQILGIPYDFRRPTLRRLRERVWNPDDPALFTARGFGVGWSINVYRLLHLGAPAKLGERGGSDEGAGEAGAKEGEDA